MFKKYIFHIGEFTFASSKSFEEMCFENGRDLFDYIMENNICDCSEEKPKIFDRPEEAEKEMKKTNTNIFETSFCSGKMFEIDCFIPFVESVFCDKDIKEYSLDCDIWGNKGDKIIKERPAFVREFVKFRGDFLSSDREVAAFGFTLSDFGA